MLFPTIKRTDPEKGFGIFKNGEATSMVHGDAVKHSLAAADGVTVLFAAASAADGFIVAGVASGKDIPASEYGFIQTYGYHGSVKANAGVTAGAAIKIGVTAKSVDIGVTADDPIKQFGCSLSATSGGRIKAFLRCM